MSVYRHGIVDGDPCCKGDCKGSMHQIGGRDACYCHLSPPCHYCVDAEFQCDTCERRTDEEPTP